MGQRNDCTLGSQRLPQFLHKCSVCPLPTAIFRTVTAVRLTFLGSIIAALDNARLLRPHWTTTQNAEMTQQRVTMLA